MTRRGGFWALLLSAALLLPPAGAALADPEDCPDFGLVPELTRLTRFKDGPGRTLDDVRYDVIVRGFGQPTCSSKDRRARVNVRLEFAIERGRAERGSRIEFSYFVAIRHRVSGEIVTKEVFPVAFDLPKGRDNVVIEEELEQVTIPIRKDEQGQYYALLVGLQLTEDQLNFNRLRRGESIEPPRPTGPATLPTLPGMPAGGGQPMAPSAAPSGAPPANRPAQGLPTLPGQPKAP